MAITISGTDGIVGAGFTVDASGVSVTAGVGTFSSAVIGSIGAGVSVPAAGLTGALPTISAANCTNIPAANITGTLPAISGANLTGIAAGVTEIDHWIVDTDFNGSVDPIQSNLTRYEQTGVTKLGTGMTVSSGIWTFPSTGYWMIIAHGQTERQAGHQCKYMQLRTKTTTNNSSYGIAAIADSTYYDNYSADERKGGCHSQVVFKCSNTGTHKVQFEATVQDNSGNGAVWSCNSGIFLTGFAFIKFAELD